MKNKKITDALFKYNNLKNELSDNRKLILSKATISILKGGSQPPNAPINCSAFNAASLYPGYC
jgi:hypothetical protein